jgi:hypothetical protein
MNVKDIRKEAKMKVKRLALFFGIAVMPACNNRPVHSNPIITDGNNIRLPVYLPKGRYATYRPNA